MSNFRETLERIYGGDLLEDLDEQLTAVVKAVRENGGTGTVNLALKIRSVGGNKVELDGDVKSKKPKAKRASSFFFFNDANELQRNDPKQVQIFEDE